MKYFLFSALSLCIFNNVNAGQATHQAMFDEGQKIQDFINANGDICGITFAAEGGHVCAYHNTPSCDNYCDNHREEHGNGYIYSCYLNNKNKMTGIKFYPRSFDVEFTWED